MSIYTHGHDEPVLRSHRWRTAANSAAYLLPLLRPDLSLLDVGAGPGTITADLAELVGSVTATEIDESVLALSRAEIASRGLTNVRFAVQDVHQLSYPDDSFDVVHAHQVLQHVADPVRALAELRRVTRPGGVVAVRDSDYAAFAWYPLLPELDRWLELYRTIARTNGGEPDAGRRLLSWAHQAGFEHVVASTSTWCFATPQDRQYWGGMWADRIVNSAIARQVVAAGLATPAELAELRQGWLAWTADPDGCFSVLHGEILCRVGDPAADRPSP
ncbi:MAG: methyltransferase domain-containing protein [Propionicimonas sp.]|nr:methyltransferase domain-containing protein [Propionicimonas sp.]